MRATLLLRLGFDWSTETNYADDLHHTLERMRELTFVDTVGERERSGERVDVGVVATFDFEDEETYARKVVELMEYAREYAGAAMLRVARGDGQASDGHLTFPATDDLATMVAADRQDFGGGRPRARANPVVARVRQEP